MKKILSLVLTLCLLISAVPTNLALSEEIEVKETAEAATEETVEEKASEAVPEVKSEPAPREEKKTEEPVKTETKKETSEEPEEEKQAAVTAPAEDTSKEEAAAPAETVKEDAPKAEETAADESSASAETDVIAADEPAEKEPEAEPAEEEQPAEEPAETEAAEEQAEEPAKEEETEKQEEETPELPDELIAKVTLDPPKNLSIVSGTYNSVKLKWEAATSADPATTYTLYSGSQVIAKDLEIASLPYEVKNLVCGTQYTFFVQAVLGQSSMSDKSKAKINYTPKPAAPASLTLTQNPSVTMTLKWAQVEGANGYYIYKQVDGGPVEALGQTNNWTNTTYADKTLYDNMGHVVAYRVTAYKTVGDGTVEGDYIEESDDVKPLAPEGLKVTGNGHSASLTWNSLVGAETYSLWRRTGTDGDFFEIASDLTGTFYEDSTDLNVETKYYYHVTAVINGTDGEPSSDVEYTHKVAKVTGLAVSEQTANSITLVWDQDRALTRYKLEYTTKGSVAPTSWVEVGPSDPNGNAKITGNVKTYTVKNLTPSTVYYFRISGVVNDKESDPSDEVTGATNPTPITDLEIDPVLDYDYNEVNLVWTEDASFSGEVEIYRASGTGAAKKIGTVAAGVKQYKDDKVTCGAEYTYTAKTLVKVTSPQAMELRSEPSNPVTVTPKNVAPAFDYMNYPDAVSATSIAVGWGQTAGASGYRVAYRETGTDSWKKAMDVAGEANVKATVASLTPGVEYDFRVAAYRTVNSTKVIGRYSDIYSFRAVPEAPKNLKVTVASATSLKVTWKALSDVKGYNIYMAEETGVETGVFGTMEKVATETTNSYTATELKTGRRYQFKICGYVVDPENDAIEYEGYESTIEEGTPVPSAPTGFKAESINSHAVKLTWKAAALGDVAGSGYEIEYSADGLTYTSLVKLTDPSTVEYIHDDSSLVCDVRYYRLHTIVPCGGVDVKSKDVELQITPVPETGTNLKLDSNNAVEITLTFDGEDTATYIVYRKEGTGSFVKQSGTPTWNSVNENWDYLDSGLKKGVDYSYRVRPSVTVGSNTYYGAYSETVTGKTKPSVPLNVKAVCKSATTIRINWTKVTEANGYQVQRSLTPKDGYATLGTTAKVDPDDSTKACYNDTTAKTGTTYFYRVRAYYTYGSNNKEYSEWVYLDTPQDVDGVQCVPMPPTEFEVKSQTYNSVTLGWKKTAGTNCTYTLTYSDGINSKDIKGIALSTVTYTIKNLEVGKFYDFSIKTVCTLADGTVLESVAENLTHIQIVPEQVTGVKVTQEAPTSPTTELYNKISWTEVNGASSYKIFRKKQGDASFTEVGNSTSSPYYDTDTSFSVGDIYIYYVQAVGPASSLGLESAEVKTTMKPLQTTGLEIKVLSATSLELTWDDMSATKYQIYRSTSSSKLGSLIKTVTTTSYTNTGLTCGTTYYYTVKAVLVSGSVSYVGAGSAKVKGKPLPLAPTNVQAFENTCLRARLTWDPMTGIDGFQLAYRETGESKWIAGSVVGKSAVQGYQKVPLTRKNYEFAVRAYKTVNGVKKYGPYSDPSASLLVEPLDVIGLATGSLSSAKIPLTWKYRSHISGYRIYMSDAPDGEYKRIGSTTKTSYNVTNVTPGALQYFRVTTYVKQNDTVYESDINSASVLTVSGYRNLAKPVLKLSNNYKTFSRISWAKITGAQGYEIQAKFAGGSYIPLETITDAALTQYRHDDTTTAMIYDSTKVIYYQVRAFTVQSDGTKVYSAWSSALKKPVK